MNWNTITDEVTQLTQDLIRFDTTNPPGNETPCIEHIAAHLATRRVSSRSCWNPRRDAATWSRGCKGMARCRRCC